MNNRIKTINEKFNEFLLTYQEAEGNVIKIVNQCEEEAGKLVAEAATEANALERLAKEKLEEIAKELEERLNALINEIRKSKEKEIEVTVEEASAKMGERVPKAVEMIVNSLLG
ncbi:V-type ATPase subunit subunit G family protein [Ignicoccus islandicus]|nr:V-type ATPase subunit subunit G family protein [Ignicoccus islandicus]